MIVQFMLFDLKDREERALSIWKERQAAVGVFNYTISNRYHLCISCVYRKDFWVGSDFWVGAMLYPVGRFVVYYDGSI